MPTAGTAAARRLDETWSNRFAPLAGLPEEEMSEGIAMDWQRPQDERGNRGRLKRRLVAELINYYRTRRAKLLREPPSYADEAVRAEELKVSIYE